MRNRVVCAMIALLLLTGLSQAAPSTRAYACTPTFLPDLQTARNNADVIFAGKVVAVDSSPFAAINTLISGTGQQRVLFSITSVWKGPVRSQAIVSVANKVCGVSIHHFNKDEDFVVFANNGALSSLEASTNSRTSELGQAAEDLQVLGQGKSPAERAELETLFYVQSYWVEAALSILLMSAFFGIVRANRAR
ncbi:MAG: hypothetical protein M3437_18785 [Chloroflexota bacterium]|nr:hypothetical protein [Chloroflexota bacterium]MDQ5867626.1 hypothetical protein [Chloroflexota bacterium]